MRDQECRALETRNRAMTEEHQVRAAELTMAHQSLEDANARTIAATAGLEQIQQERDEMRDGL